MNTSNCVTCFKSHLDELLKILEDYEIDYEFILNCNSKGDSEYFKKIYGVDFIEDIGGGIYGHVIDYYKTPIVVHYESGDIGCYLNIPNADEFEEKIKNASNRSTLSLEKINKINEENKYYNGIKNKIVLKDKLFFVDYYSKYLHKIDLNTGLHDTITLSKIYSYYLNNGKYEGIDPFDYFFIKNIFIKNTQINVQVDLIYDVDIKDSTRLIKLKKNIFELSPENKLILDLPNDILNDHRVYKLFPNEKNILTIGYDIKNREYQCQRMYTLSYDNIEFIPTKYDYNFLPPPIAQSHKNENLFYYFDNSLVIIKSSDGLTIDSFKPLLFGYEKNSNYSCAVQFNDNNVYFVSLLNNELLLNIISRRDGSSILKKIHHNIDENLVDVEIAVVDEKIKLLLKATQSRWSLFTVSNN